MGVYFIIILLIIALFISLKLGMDELKYYQYNSKLCLVLYIITFIRSCTAGISFGPIILFSIWLAALTPIFLVEAKSDAGFMRKGIKSFAVMDSSALTFLPSFSLAAGISAPFFMVSAVLFALAYCRFGEKQDVYPIIIFLVPFYNFSMLMMERIAV